MSTEKSKKKTVVLLGGSIVRNVPSRSLNQSLKEYFSAVKSFPGATTQDVKDYIKPTIARKPDMVILHTGTNNLKVTKIHRIQPTKSAKKFSKEYKEQRNGSVCIYDVDTSWSYKKNVPQRPLLLYYIRT